MPRSANKNPVVSLRQSRSGQISRARSLLTHDLRSVTSSRDEQGLSTQPLWERSIQPHPPAFAPPRAGSPSRVSGWRDFPPIFPLPSQKATYFDWYWQTRDIVSADEKAIERALIILKMLGLRKGKLLDAGCGRGLAGAIFQRAGFAVTGWDIAPEAVAQARALGIKAEVKDLENDRLSGVFDVIVASEVLQHMLDPLRVLERLKKVAAPGCRWFISLPNEFHWVRRWQILFGKIDFGGAIEPQVRFFSLGSAFDLFARANLTVLEWRAVGLVPPRQGLLAGPGKWLATWFPRSFALAYVFALEQRQCQPLAGSMTFKAPVL